MTIVGRLSAPPSGCRPRRRRTEPSPAGRRVGRGSWNSRARAHRFDLPGPLSWKQDKSRR
ncbi:hypothetical protein [Phytohabitans suffuscus]|uniref:hypothetical protein n=1 Tax=Phytohabitans suffuscus TaxID=624315 RepID=UPI001E2A015F|nr:hypothetical protein [Phytohabitans suffuscus]